MSRPSSREEDLWGLGGEVEEDARGDLDRRPESLIAAIGPDGLIVPMPESVGAPPSRVIRHVRSLVHVVAPEDRVRAIEAYELARRVGHAHTLVHLGTPGRPVVRIGISDARQEHGVFLALVVGQAGLPGELCPTGFVAPPPRTAWAHKNGTGALVEVDEAMSRMLGWPIDQLVGRSSIDFIHPDDHERAIDGYVQMLASPGRACRARLRHRCADGGWKWLEISNTNLLDDPSAGYVLAEMLDISEEMAALEELRARERLLHRLAEALPAGVLQVDCAGKVVYANRRAGQLLGAPTGTVVDARFGAVNASDRGRLRAALSKVLKKGMDYDVEVGVTVGPGSRRRCQVAIRALTADDGAVTGAIICVTDVTDGARLRAELERRATTDMPTGCWNRNWVMATLAELIRPGADLAVVFVDIDDFKSVNDRFGHVVGDQVLVAVAERLRSATRASDVVGRVGGDEFIVVCPEAGGLAGAERLASRIAGAVDHIGPLPGALGIIRASVGMAYAGERDLSADQLVAEADAVMYATKATRHQGR